MKKNCRCIAAFLIMAIVFSEVGAFPVVAAERERSWRSFADQVKEKASAAADAAGKAKDKAAQKAEDTINDASEKMKKYGSDAAVFAQKSLSGLSKEAQEAGNSISEKAKETKNAASAGIALAGAALAAAASNLDTDRITDGLEFTGKLTATNLSVALGTQDYTNYINGISEAIETMRKDLNKSAYNSRGVAQEKGFIFEKWHADTFNIDAAAKRSKEWAKQLEENGEGSVDVRTSYGEEASMKAMKNSKESAKAQAEVILSEGYRQYAQEAKEKGESYSLQDYVNNHASNEEAWEIIKAKYEGQTRIVPSDHVDNARAYLQGRADKLDIPSEYTAQQKKIYQETMDSLKDHLESPKGTKSKPLSSGELQALTEAAKEGDVDLSEYGITVSDYVSRSVIAGQVLSAGASAAILQTAITIGPDIYKIIAESLKNGNVDEGQLKEIGLDAALAGAGGFAEGSISQAILIACRAGKFGDKLKGVSPDTVGTTAVLMVDAARYAYQFSNGEITANDYADLMAEEVFVAIAAETSGAALQALLPMIPFAYFAGSMAGGMLASTGYQIGKEVVMEVRDEGGMAVVLPAKVKEGYNMGKELLAVLDFSHADNAILPREILDVQVRTTPQNQIQISQATGILNWVQGR